MQTHFLFDLMAEHPQYREVLEEIRKDRAVIAASGLVDAQKVHLACALAMSTSRPLLYLCESERAAAAAMEDIQSLIPGGVSLFPARDITFYQEVAASREVACRRIETLHKLITGQTRVVVASADTVLHRLMPRRGSVVRSLICFCTSSYRSTGNMPLGSQSDRRSLRSEARCRFRSHRR